MESVPGAIATGSVVKLATGLLGIDPVAIAPGTDSSATTRNNSSITMP